MVANPYISGPSAPPMLWSGLLNTRSVCYTCDGPDARDRGVARPVRLCARCCLLLWAAGVAIHAVSFVFVRFLVCVCVCVCGCLLPLLTMLLCVDWYQYMPACPCTRAHVCSANVSRCWRPNTHVPMSLPYSTEYQQTIIAIKSFPMCVLCESQTNFGFLCKARNALGFKCPAGDPEKREVS